MDWPEVRPVLDAAYRLLDDAERVGPDSVLEALGRPAGDERTERAIVRLYKNEYFGGKTIKGTPVPVWVTATEKGLREARGWPSDASQQVEQLLLALDRRIEDPETPEPERGRLRRIRHAAAEVAPRLMASVLVEYAERLGLGGSSSGGSG